MRKAILGLAVLALLVVSKPLAAQTTYNSVEVLGSASYRAQFYFGHAPNGQPGSTELFVECDLKQASFTTNFDAAGELNSLPFAISCDGGPTYTVHGTPLTVTLTMYDLNWNPAGQVTLTINSASFTNPTRYHRATGSASITY